MSLLEKLEQGIVLADGAMGTVLQTKGLPRGDEPSRWNLSNPNAVQALTEAYLEAGAQVVRTNTFGANEPMLQTHGLADKEDQINRKGAEIALACTKGTDACVAASIGPTGLHFAPTGYEDFNAAVQIFTVQIRALQDAGIGVLSFESFTDITEMRAAIIAANHLGNFEIISSMTYGSKGVTESGTPADACAVICSSLGADVVGANCSTGPNSVAAAVETMGQTDEALKSAMPSAGVPLSHDGHYPLDPEAFAVGLIACANAGARLLGGCCGTTPDYIRAAANKLNGLTASDVASFTGGWIASPLGALDLNRDDLRFAQMDLSAVKDQLETDDFSSVSYALPADWEFCDACVLDFHGLTDDFNVEKLVTAVTLYLKKPVILTGGSSELTELFLQYYPGRAAVMRRARMPKLLFGALVVGRGYKPVTAVEHTYGC